jgi:2-polyprenyl-6-methoxyphenol hydroxylase-like FAD-dependent oxidoreductase
MIRSDVLIIGAGPTGLVLALWLKKLGANVRIVDKTAESGTTSRALAVQARTLELYRQLELADEVFARAHKTPAVNFWVQGKRAAHVAFKDVGTGLSPYPFLLMFPQDQHERLLVERLHAAGVDVERRTELLSFSELNDRVTARLRHHDGSEESCEATYIAGCDGAHSLVREHIGASFSGGTYKQLFYVADVEVEGAAVDGELHVDLDEADFLALFPLAGTGRARLIGTVRDERAEHPDTLKFEDVSTRAIEQLKLSVRKVNWFSTYRVHHRVTDRFRKGRAFLLGDAAHIHSPVGGQGMNTGIGDAINLAWKLAAVTSGRAAERVLDSYESERMGFAHRLVATTDRVFSFATAEGHLADLVRLRMAPLLIPKIFGFEATREFLYRTVAQLTLNYRGGPMSSGVAGHVHGGDRLPWAVSDGQDNFKSLAALTWQVHVYGSASDDVRAWCKAHEVALHVFDWRDAHQAAGLARDATYLLRPDSYVALADADGGTRALDRYWLEHGLRAA